MIATGLDAGVGTWPALGRALKQISSPTPRPAEDDASTLEPYSNSEDGQSPSTDPTGLYIATGKNNAGWIRSGNRYVDTEQGAIDWLYHAVVHGLTGSPDETPIVP